MRVRKVFGGGKVMNEGFDVEEVMCEGVEELRIGYGWEVVDGENEGMREDGEKKKERKSKGERERIGKWEGERMEKGERVGEIVRRRKEIILKEWRKWNEEEKRRGGIVFDKLGKVVEG